MAIQIVGQHPYGSDGNVWQVSDEAIAEKRANWHEFVGWADGQAYVEHPDWWALFARLQETVPPDQRAAGRGHAFLVHVVDGKGALAHVGSISRCYSDGTKLILAG
jgi:hypothetical protein